MMRDEPPIVQAPAQATGQPPRLDRPDSEGSTPTVTGKLDWLLNNKLALLAMLFFATAALGIPLLWKSPKFSTKERVVWSILVSLYTLVIFVIFGAIMWWSYSRIRGSF